MSRPETRAPPVGLVVTVIDSDVLERVLAGAVRTGADFAEVYAEDKRSTSAGLDDGRVEQVTSGRDRGAGIRVVAGETTGFAYTPTCPRPASHGPPPAAAAAAQPGRWRRAHRRPHAVGAAPAEHDRAGSRLGRQGGQGRAAATDRRSRPLLRPGDRPGVGRLRRQPQADPRRQHRRRVGRGRQSSARCCGSAPSPTATPACRPASSRWATRSASRCSTRSTSRSSPARRRARRSPSSAPVRRRRGAMPVVIKHGTGGVLFHEACGHGLEADLIAKGASVYAGKVGEQVASPLVTLVDDGTMPGEWGTLGIDDEGHTTPAQRADRGRRAHRLHVGLPAGPQGGSPAVGQRPPPELHAPADGADDEHVRARRPRRPRRHHPLDRERRVRRQARRRQRQHGDRRLRVRHDRGVPDRERRDHRAAARGQPDRQRARRCCATSTCSATTSPWAARARAARTARACRSATASRRCG